MEMGIYSNESFSQEPTDTGNRSRQADAGSNQQRIYQRVGICFGLLCLLQVTLNISLHVFSMNKRHSSLAEDRDLLQENNTHAVDYINLTQERDGLQKQLEQTMNECHLKYNLLVEERDWLLANNTKLAEERDRIHKKVDDLTKWKSFQSSLYFFSGEKKTWHEARKDCRQRGSDLVIINSKDEQMFVSLHVHDTWIGLTDREQEGQWKWVDGTLLTNGMWLADEPNDASHGEDCAKAYGTQWNDQMCSLIFKWTCEKLNST